MGLYGHHLQRRGCETPSRSAPEIRKPRVPGRGKGTVWIGPDFEFTEAEIKELFEAPLFPPDEAP
jgi:hypothetical protein